MTYYPPEEIAAQAAAGGILVPIVEATTAVIADLSTVGGTPVVLATLNLAIGKYVLHMSIPVNDDTAASDAYLGSVVAGAVSPATVTVLPVAGITGYKRDNVTAPAVSIAGHIFLDVTVAGNVDVELVQTAGGPSSGDVAAGHVVAYKVSV